MSRSRSLLLCLSLAIACSSTQSRPSSPAQAVTVQEADASDSQPEPAVEQTPTDDAVTSVEQLIAQARSAIAAGDMTALSKLAHPTQGIRFSPYAHVEMQSDIVLRAAELARAKASADKRTWGSFDGTGDPIRMTFAEYFERFVSIPGITSAKHAVNEPIQTGNTINNIADAYPNASFVEFHHPGSDPRYDGMDWSSLRVVFVQEGRTFFIIGLVHDQWTI